MIEFSQGLERTEGHVPPHSLRKAQEKKGRGSRQKKKKATVDGAHRKEGRGVRVEE